MLRLLQVKLAQVSMLPNADQLAKAKEKADQAKAHYQALQARLNVAERKLETRRKIILGGLLLDAAEKDEKFARALQVLVGRVSRDQDAKAFEGWQQPRPAAPAADPAPTPAPAPPKLGQEGKDPFDFSHIQVDDVFPRSMIPE